MISASWLRLFNEQELQILLSGTFEKIDISDFKEHTQYTGVYDPEHPTIKLFWDVVENDFSTDQVKALVKFITS